MDRRTFVAAAAAALFAARAAAQNVNIPARIALLGSSPQPYTLPNYYYFASVGGFRLPNKVGALSGTGASTATYYANTLKRVSPNFAIIDPILIWPNFYLSETNSTVNEVNAPTNFTIEAARIKYGSTTMAGTVDNAGLIDASDNTNGCIFTRHTGTLPANSAIDVTVALALSSAGQSLISGAGANSGAGEKGRMGVLSFASAVNAGSDIATVTSTSGTIASNLYQPVGIIGKGLDGRDVKVMFGDSIGYGAGSDDALQQYGIRGMSDYIAYRSTNGYQMPTLNLCCSSSAGQYLDPTNASYTPTILKKRLAILSQAAALNAGGIQAFTMICLNWWNNDEGAPYATLALAKALIKAEHDFFRSRFPSAVQVRMGPLPKAGSQAGFVDSTEQTVLSISSYNPAYSGDSTGLRFGLRDDMIATHCDGAFEYFLDPIPYLSWDTGVNRDKWASAGSAGLIAAGDAGSGATIVGDTLFAVGDALFVPGPSNDTTGRTRTVTAVSGSGPWTYTTEQTPGTLSGSYPTRSAGRAVVKVLPGDSNPVSASSGRGVHPSTTACALAAPMGDGLKNSRRAAVNGKWT